MVKKSRRGRPPIVYDAAEWAVKLFKENPPQPWTEGYLAKIRKVSRGTMRAALQLAEKIHPEDWERWEARPHAEDPRYLGPVPPGQGVVHHRKDLGSWFLYSHTEAIQEETQRKWLEWRLANPPTMGSPIVSTMRLQDDARLRVHRVEDIRREIPEWDSLTKGEKVQALRRVRPSREMGKR